MIYLYDLDKFMNFKLKSKKTNKRYFINYLFILVLNITILHIVTIKLSKRLESDSNL